MTAPQSPNEHRNILRQYLQEGAVDDVLSFLNHYRVHLNIVGERRSKLGDYRRPTPSRPYHSISINGNLNAYMFLTVLLHEEAHLLTFLQHGTRVAPHGHEWQAQYRALLLEHAAKGHFPADTLPLLRRYTAHIPLYNPAGQQWEKALSGYGAEPVITVSDLPLGSLFRIKNHPQYLFQSMEKRRTRYRCTEVTTGKSYLVPGNATALPVQQGNTSGSGEGNNTGTLTL